MALSGSDLKKLRLVLEVGHRLERTWPASNELELLKSAIGELQTAESEDLSRLAFHTRNLKAEMTAQHLAAVLVPFERLQGKALRDDEFLVTEIDQIEAERSVEPLTVIAENIRSAFNIGAIFRTAEAFGAEEIVLAGYSSTPSDERTAKTSLGTQDHISWRAEPESRQAILELKNKGYKIVALETAETAVSIEEYEWPEKCALVLGNERFGVDIETLALVDEIVRIPLHGRKNSLNVGIALGIALADWRGKIPRRPIGTFHSSTKNPYEARRQGTENHSSEIATIDLAPGRMFEQALEDLDGFERVWLVYEFHHNLNWKPKVLPPRGPHIKRGVFATRSPYRPNNIGLSCVELVKIEGRTISVKGFDLLDGTPILDIKPYLPSADAFPNARAGWTETLKDHAYQVASEPQADEQIAWLRAEGFEQIEGFAHAQLEYEPTDSTRKRVAFQSNQTFVLSYRTWRIHFTTNEAQKLVSIIEVTSGYTEADLSASEDPYSDKEIHRRYNSYTNLRR